MSIYHFPTVEDARHAGVDDEGIERIVAQVKTHRQLLDADRAARRRVRKAARIARRANR